MRLTHPNYISQETFDAALRDFHDNADGKDMGEQAAAFVQLFRTSCMYNQMQSAVTSAVKASGDDSKEGMSGDCIRNGYEFWISIGVQLP